MPDQVELGNNPREGGAATKAGGQIQIHTGIRPQFSRDDIRELQSAGGELSPRQLAIVVRILEIHLEMPVEDAGRGRVVRNVQLQEEQLTAEVQARNRHPEINLQLRSRGRG